jgi:hypothetical protein
MPGLPDVLPDADALLAVSTEELGMILLDLCRKQGQGNLTLSNIEMSVRIGPPAFPFQKNNEVARAIGEAWQWLLNEGLMMMAPDQPNGWYCVTRKGRELRAPDIETYKQGDLLPDSLVHPTLRYIRPMFLRGDYDDAVLRSFIRVEEAVRAAGKYDNRLITRKLMQTAFNPDNGPLTDHSIDKGERVGLMELFSGAIGYCKNPSSHRTVGIERTAAAQLILFASYLLSQTDAKAKP